MAGDHSSQQSPDPGDRPLRSDQGWVAISYLISGIAVWGFIGWLIDGWLGSNGVATGIGAVLGAAGGIFLLVRRLSP